MPPSAMRARLLREETRGRAVGYPSWRSSSDSRAELEDWSSSSGEYAGVVSFSENAIV